MARIILGSLALTLLVGAAAPAVAATVHRRTTFTVVVPNLRMNDANPDADGPFGSRFFDLDGARQLHFLHPSTDVEVNVNARRATFAFGLPPGRRMVMAGASPPTYSRCLRLLSSSPSGGPAERAPTHYRCVRTSDNRVARFRVVSWSGNYKPDSYVDLHMRVETVVWNP